MVQRDQQNQKTPDDQQPAPDSGSIKAGSAKSGSAGPGSGQVRFDAIVVSAPSGTGKTTLNRRLTEQFSNFEISVSYTTRPQRPGEREGVHYHFVSVDRFQSLVERGKMLEYASVFGTFYGTALDELERITRLGKRVILEIDVQGWRQAKPRLSGAVSVFILPPSIRVLWERLAARGTESLEKRWRRLQTARSEIESAQFYDVFVINEELDEAYRELTHVVIECLPPTLSHAQGLAHCAKLLAEFEEPWVSQLADEVTASVAVPRA